MSDLAWFKSSFSDSSGGDCVEVAAGPAAAPAATPAAVHVRDSKDPGRGRLRVTPGAWRAFLEGYQAR